MTTELSNTPETDRVVRNAAMADHPPTRLAATLTVKCEKLERERDEARVERDSLQALSQSLAETYAKLKTERDEWAKLCGQYKQERDEARARP
jgi:uncharacterized coiled-coil DUF342 family protein